MFRMILRARWLIDRRFKIHSPAAIHIGEGKEIVDLGDSILLPGLINAHCHLDYTDFRNRISPQEEFTKWIQEINFLKSSWREEDFIRSIQHGLDESIRYGTTTIANWICNPHNLTPISPSRIRVWWLWEQIAFRSTEPDLCQWNSWLTQVHSKSPFWFAGLAPHALYTCRTEVIESAARWSKEHRRLWSIHLAESKEEWDMFCHARGPLFDLLAGLGRNMSDCGQETPVARLKKILLKIPSQTLWIHVNYLNSADYALIESLITEAKRDISIVHCPRSHTFFKHKPFPINRLRAMGVNICLGTDSLASNEDLSMFAEMKLCSELYPEIKPQEIFQLATLHGARALGVEKEWLNWNDWIAIPATNRGITDLWETVVRFTGEPQCVMVDGKLVRQTLTRN